MNVIDKMQLQGRRCVVIVKQGKPYRGIPAAIFEGTSEYGRVKPGPRVVIVGYYDPECLVRHLAGDVQEFFKGNT
jgi:hypothetical protein